MKMSVGSAIAVIIVIWILCAGDFTGAGKPGAQQLLDGGKQVTTSYVKEHTDVGRITYGINNANSGFGR